jgi:hypothetical protein
MTNIVLTVELLCMIWLVGLLGHFGGVLINLLLLLVVIGVVYNLVMGRRAV